MSRRVRGLMAAAIGTLRGEEGQALTESTIILSGMLLTLFFALPAVTHYAPDLLEAITIYVRGFYVVLGYPMG